METKRIFLIWHGGESAINLISELEKVGYKVVYWVSTDNPDRSRLTDIIYHDHYDAWEGKPAPGIDPDIFPPPGKDLIEKMHKTESLILTMMTKKFDTRNVDERRHIYYGMLRYWNGVINKFKPEAVVFSTVPHTVYDYLIYELARMLGIKTIMFEDTWVSDRLIMYNDWREGSRKLLKELEKNKCKNFSIDDLSPDIKEYYLKQTNPAVDSTPVYTKFYKSNSQGLNFLKRKIQVVWKSIRQGKFFSRVISFIHRHLQMNLEKEYKQFAKLPDFSKSYVYVALSFQPERTSSPQADIFVDQILMIETLAHSLPEGWVAYVKEHPTQWIMRGGKRYFSARYPGYYRRIAEIKNVFLVPIETSTYELMKHCKAVCATSGTAGWEGILRGKPMLNFGYPWYRDCPEAFRVSDAGSCRKALELIKNAYKVDQNRVINFLKALDNATMHGYLEKFIKSELSETENKAAITGEIIAYLQSGEK